MIKRGKSYGYQHRIMEIITDPGSLSNYSNEDSISTFFSRSDLPEELEGLRDRLVERLKNIIFTRLTSHQRDVTVLFLEGNTQEEIASVLKIHQTGVHKALHGNIDYSSGQRRYGGVIKKLRKICSEDKEIKEILFQIEEYKNQEL